MFVLVLPLLRFLSCQTTALLCSADAKGTSLACLTTTITTTYTRRP